ncbi:hypothetical protein AAC387_Pa04g1743 [Persea americana]
MEFIVGACIDAMKNGWEFFTNLRSFESIMRSLRERTDELSAREHDVMMEVRREEEEKGKKRKREVELWLDNVKRVKNEVDSVEEKVREERRWILHYRLRKHIADLETAAVQLYDKSRFSNGVANEMVLGSGSPQPTSTLLGESADRTFQMIWNLLLDVKVRKVGVHGMAGVGKTTIMKHINNQLLHLDVFKNIIWVAVSKALDLPRLQREIANAIGLDLPNDCDVEEERIASKICAALSRREKCLLILDDLWEPFSLERIGIPEPNHTNGFKLAITTRLLKVCTCMESDRIVKVELLSDEEAWTLFKEKVGGSILDSLELEPIAKCITKECGRLPLAIITVGRALREVRVVSVWRNALDELKQSYAEIHGMGEYVFPRLMFGYNRLRNDWIKDCFLYCALYPEDHEIDIDGLIENWVGEGLVGELGNIKKERDKGISILSELKEACMLEDGRPTPLFNIPTVKLHDLVRDLVIKITRERPRFLVKAREQLEESPRAEEWMEDTKRISLVDNNINRLSGQPMCPELSTLLLQENKRLQKISNSFFENMQGLRVLDLSYSSIKSLPKSVSKLEHLRVLRLYCCEDLEKLPSVAKLKQLRVLSLDSTSIEELPQGMKALVNLRKLNLNYTNKLQFLPAGIISKLPLLKDLQMIESGWRWPSNIAKVAADIEEIVNLTPVANLRLSFEDVHSFIKLVGSDVLRKVETFSLVIGDLFSIPLSYLVKNAVVMGCGSDVGSHASSIFLPCNTCSLGIEGCHDITRLSQFSCLANATRLKHCHIEQCDGMEFIIGAGDKTLLNLERLELSYLHSLRALSDGVPSIETFANLKHLSVGACKKMKNLLSLGLLRNLQALERIEIWSCVSMEDVVAGDWSALTTFSLPNLKSLSLQNLNELKSIFFKATVTCPSLESVVVGKCGKLKKLPFTSQNPSLTLKSLKGDKEWWDALEWDDPAVKIQLQERFVITQ